MYINDSNYFSCPYCGSDNDLSVDPTGGKRQKFVVDCVICCQPIIVEVTFTDGIWDVVVRRENE